MILELILFEWLICKLEIGDIKLKKYFAFMLIMLMQLKINYCYLYSTGTKHMVYHISASECFNCYRDTIQRKDVA